MSKDCTPKPAAGRPVDTFDPRLLTLGDQVISKQKQENFRQSCRNHWRAIVWSFVISTALYMEGYDTGLTSNFYGLTQFKYRFGEEHNGKWSIPAKDQTALSNLATVGQLVGLVLTGYFQERFGMKWTYIAGMSFMIMTIFVAVFAQNLPMLMAAEFLMGMPWGMFQTLATAYVAELCPINVRGYAAAYASMGWGGGKLLATGVLRGCLQIKGDLAWRLAYALQWVWPIPLLAIAFLAPESPWWLVRHGRDAEAARVLRRLSREDWYQAGELNGYLEHMRFTIAMERESRARGSFADMFRKTNLRRTEIELGAWLLENWNGSAIYGLAVVFLQAAGMATTASFDVNLVLQSFSIIGVGLSWILMRYTGRRPIMLWGLVATIIPNLIIGGLGTMGTGNTGSLYTVGALMIFINFNYHLTIGPVTYTVASEIPASTLRVQCIAFGRFVYVVNGIIIGTLNPYMVSETAWNWGAKSGFFWAGTGCLCLAWTYFRMPETAGLSFADLDVLFANRVTARQFTKRNLEDEYRKYEGQSHLERVAVGHTLTAQGEGEFARGEVDDKV